MQGTVREARPRALNLRDLCDNLFAQRCLEAPIVGSRVVRMYLFVYMHVCVSCFGLVSVSSVYV